MYQDEMYEVKDVDEEMKQREALIEEAKSLDPEAEWNAVARQVGELQRKWKRLSGWESAYEEKLNEEFDSILNVFYAKRRAGYQNARERKESLIKQAKELLSSEDMNKATSEVNALMEEWRTSGSVGNKEEDDKLWESFHALRQKFYDRKHEQWENLQKKFAHAREVKEQLIEQAASLCDSSEWQKTSEAYHKMMEEWKAVGSAGRKYDDELWNRFNETRQKFYDRRNAHYDELHEQHSSRYEQKKELVEKAKEIAESEEYTKEHTEQMKRFGVDWKEVGYCGKKEDAIWAQFRSFMDAYFDGLKQWNEQRHAQWRQRMVEARNRKTEMIANQKRQIQRLEQDMVGLLGERAIEDAQAQIEDKKEFIRELEEQLADIEKTLENE